MLEILLQAGMLVAIIAMGYLLRRFGLVPKEAFLTVSHLVLYVTLPCVVIRNFARTELDASYLAIIMIGFCCMALYVGIGWLINRRRGVSAQTFDMLNLTGFNIGCFALPYISGLLGPAAVVAVCMFDAGSAFGATGGVTVVCRSMLEGKGFHIGSFLKRFLKAYLPIVYIAMVLLRLFAVPIPDVIVRFCDLCGAGNSFLAMLMIGLGLTLSVPRSGLRWIGRALLIRVGVAALCGLLFWSFLPFSREIRLGAVLAVLAPVSALNPAFTDECGGDYELAASWNTISIFVSLLLMTAVMLLAA